MCCTQALDTSSVYVILGLYTTCRLVYFTILIYQAVGLQVRLQSLRDYLKIISTCLWSLQICTKIWFSINLNIFTLDMPVIIVYLK